MGDTTEHGLPYPVGTDRVMDGDNAIQALAEAIDTAMLSDTGQVTAAAAGFTILPGFNTLAGNVRRRGDAVTVNLTFKSANAIAAGNTGNLSCVQFPDGWYPLMRTGVTTGAEGPGVFFVAEAGVGRLYVVATAGSIAAGSTISAAGLWLV